MPATEFLGEIADKSVVKVLGMACNDLDYKDTPFNGQHGNIAVSSTQVEDEDITFASDLLVEAVGDSGSCRAICNIKNVEATIVPASSRACLWSRQER